jgi:hypothetical protein
VLEDLSVSTPDNLWLIDFDEVGGNATFTGLALDNETIARFMRQLQDSPYFYGVDLVETSRSGPNGTTMNPAADSGGTSFSRFIVKATIDYFGRDGKPPEPPPGQAAAAQPAAAPVKKEPAA